MEEQQGAGGTDLNFLVLAFDFSAVCKPCGICPLGPAGIRRTFNDFFVQDLDKIYAAAWRWRRWSWEWWRGEGRYWWG